MTASSWLIFLLAASVCILVAGDCPNNCFSAYSHGNCVTALNTCNCTQWWTGADCSISINNVVDWDSVQCLHGGLYTPPYFTEDITRYCACNQNWTGVDCAQCTNDTSCSFIQNPEGDNYICDNSLVIFEGKQFNCTPTDPLFKAFFGTGIIAANCTLPEDNTGVCHFDAYVKPTGAPLMFNCTFSQCSKDFDGSQQHIKCAKSKCQCTSICIDIVRQYIESAETTTTFDCDVEKGMCYVSQAEINLLNDSPFSCLARECRDPKGVPQYSTGQKENKELVLAVSIGIPLLIVLVACLAVAFHTYHRRLLSRDLDDLGAFRATLSFVNVSCFIYEESTDSLVWLYNYILRVSGLNKEKRKQREVLHSVSGKCIPGQVTAILGPSGSGKTTLLDILSKRKTVGRISGTVLVNDTPRNYAFKRISGYVSQEDILLDTLTVREHLDYCAQFRLPENMPLGRKKEKVDEVIRDLGLKAIEHSRIGSVARRGISGGERKRVTIASELLVDPSILFLDEPTSGLDSHQAHLLVQTIVHLARSKNRTVVMAIHQPRSNIYELFDQICLLKDGISVYFGPAAKAAPYFSEKGHVCPPNYNVPDFLLDVISMLPSDQLDAFGKEEESLKKSRNSSREELLASGGDIPLKSTSEDYGEMLTMAETTNEYPTTPWHQTVVLTKRSLLHIIRKPQLLRVQYAMGIGIGIIMGWVFYHVTDDYAGGGVTNRIGALFFIGALLSFTSITSIDAFFSERLLFARERGNGSYRTSAYFFSKLFTEILVQKIIPTLLAAAISYGMVGFRTGSNHFGLYLLYLLEIGVCAATMCLAISAVVPSVAVGNIIAISILFLFLLFAGFLVSLDSIPSSLSWLQYISFLKYAFEGMLVNEMHGLKLLFNFKGYPSFYILGDVLLTQMNININVLYPNVFILVAWMVWYIFWTYVFLKLFVKEHR